MTFWCFYLACITSPGYSPKGWKPNENTIYPLPEFRRRNRQRIYNKLKNEISGDDNEKIDQSINAELNHFCIKCNQYKPPRSHHCKYCKRCVLKMDHHCPWIGNCVGYGNQKFFMQFIAYAAIAIVYTLICLGFQSIHIYRRINSPGSIPSPVEIVVLSLLFAILLPLAICLILLWFIQLNLILHNLTTLEYELCETIKREIHKKKGSKREKWHYPYDISSNFVHFCSVFGENKWDWFWPINTTNNSTHSDGISWKVRQDFKIIVEIREDISLGKTDNNV